ncbi:conserved hypothetical protein [Theileria orientalis strain Shintoku]|uniref:Uncharacterized protein n=1 Tax=Theileria orientalis strain Shintoku TaxID=869250 RepID=J4CDX3_THEOR|nr:conserved hypothetical protein [Theileria orientalis strain Shintoku]BAM41892.1 conserved hypothetical protein [Theileria orientalis strain Shintoku]|eukprot:XP_009692193.1 conserved hypothetical protein [Theileria orientalis strain Shintoku]
MSESSPGTSSIGCKIIAAFVSLSSHLVMHQIDVTSAHFSVAFNIPLNNISIYFSKLFSFRCLLIALGTLAEFLISQIFQHVPDPGGGESDKAGNDSPNRKYISMVCFAVVLIIRVVLLFTLYFSSKLGYHVYVILSVESFFFGYFHASVLALVPEHSLAVALAANVSRFFILFVQFILDVVFFSRPLLMIKLQNWVGVLVTLAALISWICYHETSTCADKDSETLRLGNGTTTEGSSTAASGSGAAAISNGDNQTKDFTETFLDAFSPFFMFFAGSMFKDFLYPGVLPYALLHRDKCHMINMFVPVANMIGPVTLFILESIGQFKKWVDCYNVFWMLAIPMGGIFIFSMLAIHTRIPSARRIANSKVRVMLITLGVVFGNGFLDPLSFGGVAKVVSPDKTPRIANGQQGNSGSSVSNTSSHTDKYDRKGNNRVITFHAFFSLFMRFVFSKLSVGYNDTRVRLGYFIPKFRPNHRMSKTNLAWYVIRQTFKMAWRDTGSDFKMNIERYL